MSHNGYVCRMTDVSLEFVSRQLDRVLDRLGAIEDQITVLTGMAMRHDGSLAGLAVEIRGLMQSVSRAELRLRKLEDEPS
jgi:hypothetical protein